MAVRNVGLNLLGHAVPLVVALAAIPLLVEWLGIDRFGVLSLVWVVLGYFGVLDLGLARATTKFVADRFAAGDDAGAETIGWLSATIQAGFGLLVGGALALASGFLAGEVLRVPETLLSETRAAFRILGVAIPLTMIGNTFRGILEGGHRFDLVTLARIPLASLSFLLPLLGAGVGLGLPGIVVLLAAGRALGVAVHLVLCQKAWPGRFRRPRLRMEATGALLRFGGWVAVSSAVIPLFVYLDRFLLGALSSLEAVTYYTAPYEATTRLLILPAAVAGVLFPVSSALAARGEMARVAAGTSAATRWTAALLTLPVCVVIVASEPILDLWLGAPFPSESGTAFRLLAAATLLNALGYAPVALLEGIGRPDVVARYHLVELPLYVGVLWVCVTRWGVDGAAFAWMMRMAWTIPLFFYLTTRVTGLGPGAFFGRHTQRVLVLGGLAVLGSVGLVASPLESSVQIATLLLVVPFWIVIVWRWAMSVGDRDTFRAQFRRIEGPNA